MIAFDVTPVFSAGDKVKLVPRATDFYDPLFAEGSVAEVKITGDVRAEINAKPGDYWLIGDEGQSVAVTVPEGHEKAASKK